MINKKVKLIDAGNDNFREAIGKKWTPSNDSKDSTVLKYNEPVVDAQLKYKFHDPELIEGQGSFPYFLQKMTITSYDAGIGSVDSWESYLNSIISNAVVLDHHFEMPLPEQVKNTSGFLHGQNSSTYRVEPSYNFIAERYEEHVNPMNEKTLPNIYICDSPMADSYAGFRPFRKGKPLKGRFVNFTKNEKANFATDMDPLYFDKMSNIVLDSGYKTSKVNSIVDEYPYDIKLTVTQPRKPKRIFNFIHDLGIYPFLLNDTIDSGGSIASFQGSFAGNSNNLVDTVNFQLIDLLEWSSKESYGYNENNKLYYGNDSYKNKTEYATGLQGLIFNGFTKDIIKNHLRSYEDIIDGAACENEILFFQIEKFKDATVGEPLQTFWVPARTNSINYIDTQLKYDNLYVYRVSAYVAVVGNSYAFTNLENISHNTKTGMFSAEVTIENRCSMKLVKVPFFIEQARVINPPPSIPLIDFYNRSDATNMINIRMALTSYYGSGGYVSIGNGDDLIRTKLQQFYKNKSEKSVPRPTNSVGIFEIFRTSTPPKSYQDFSRFKLLEITSEANTTSQMIEDKILPNTKYYYCFRSINHHGIKSLPTKVMEVELIKDADDSKVEVNVYEFPKDDPYQKTTNMKRFFQVIPSQNQTYFDPEQNSIYGTNSLNNKLKKISLGLAEKSIWGRKMKIRLTSTDTGRKIDFNITFDLIKEKSEE